MVNLKSIILFFLCFSSLNAVQIAPTNFDLRSLSILVSEECQKNILISKDIKNLSADYFFTSDINSTVLFASFKKVIESKGLYLNDYEGFYVVEQNKKVIPIKRDYSNIELTVKVIEINNDKINSKGFKSLIDSTFNANSSFVDFSNLSFDSLLTFKLSGLLKVLEEQDYIKILSEPKVLIANGKTTTMNIGDTKSILTSSVSDDTSSDNTVRNTYTQKDVGLTIKATPLLLEDNKINLKVDLTLESLKDYDKGLVSTSKRSIQSNFNILDGGSTLIGGLIQKQDILDKDKVPLLGDIPVIKYAFSYESKKSIKTTLSIFIKVKVIK